MSCVDVTYAEKFTVTANNNAEQKLAGDVLNGNFLHVQNNTQYDVNLLVWTDSAGTGKPVQLAIRSGGAQGIEMPLGKFEVWAAVLNINSIPVLPAGAGGVYSGPDAVQASVNAMGYIMAVAYSQAVSITQNEGNFQAVSVSQKPLSYYTERNYQSENNYQFYGAVDSSEQTIVGATYNTLEQVVRFQGVVKAIVADTIQMDIKAPLGKPGGPFLYQLHVSSGCTPFDIEMPCIGLIPKGWQIKLGGQITSSLAGNMKPVVQANVTTAIIQV